ncbi:4-oxalocrotonate tautomerase [Flexibacter flexilis DSM 6793]|uniref:4-oxalocrotonate tautomerase n=1 Tax=Flexibacter flexilis DSM 6793 TaxID=927664 RepID=A0A1I1DT30_9BACT|nr:tautomerase family protein [Flexibacter flexilis]SFB75880.1 4-oxalocrotonate tautomerase [Flexibacter flexilis DSM 6793]
MPILNLKVSGEASDALAQTLANDLTDLTAEFLKKKPEVTAITVAFVPENQWFVNRQTLATLGLKSFYLDIKVTESTNLKDEKEQYIAAVFERMQQRLGALHSESYVYVEEVKADSYGFGGLTQEYRYVKAKF